MGISEDESKTLSQLSHIGFEATSNLDDPLEDDYVLVLRQTSPVDEDSLNTYEHIIQLDCELITDSLSVVTDLAEEQLRPMKQ
jgi:hypothetical protein